MQHDVAIVGGGIVGAATAMAIASRSDASLALIEAESCLAAHQTGHNSGVIHSGLYYKPGSLKASLCTAGREEMYRFCAEHGIPHERCGKVVVATCEAELPALEELQRRGTANGLKDLQLLQGNRIQEHEPNAAGVAALLVPDTGIVDYARVTQHMGAIVQERGGVVRTRAKLLAVRRETGGLVLETTAGEVRCHGLINCAGLQCDRVAAMCGHASTVRIVPFRGEYYDIRPERRSLVRNLIYPVPDPRFPFLGVHFTRTIDGRLDAGPNAVPAMKREGYRWRDVRAADLWATASFPGTWRLLGKYWRSAAAEVYRSLSKRAFVAAAQRLVPTVTAHDLEPAAAGVRAQALERSGALVDDFRIVETERAIHVLNAPSPAATASITIGRTIAEKAVRAFGLRERN